MGGRKVIVIGRHEFTEVQKRLIEKAGLQKIKQIQHVNDITKLIQEAKELNADILVQAMPMHLLAQLLSSASREGITVYSFKLEPVGLFDTEEAARRSGADVIVPSREGTYRGMKTRALQKLIRIEIVTEDVITAE
ncbi:hypothetical protein [Pyrococcus kukulkanii]|uniref:hypothetical protein n=1 Tax=Pyrococcus kukulkanii TaxID=1609559 RepID=UPI0035697535